MGVSLSSRGFKRNENDDGWVEVWAENGDPFDSSLKDWTAVTTGEGNFSKIAKLTEAGTPPGLKDFFKSERYEFDEYCYAWATIKKLRSVDFDKTMVRDIRSLKDWHTLEKTLGFDKTIGLAQPISLREFLGDEFIQAIALWENVGAELLVFYSY